eukprot:MONOS_9213.1-p1 / transcript=MONOS_9213.1 / gene=MONOS_9213 / organism=Monocercomonoides_exilis_PA203 / gene_product=unspecified product / transcript_product=unspecified product / location=Mono_scaffold00372:96-2716(-) / protein_length=625 / sequence_SO=supercontig / SO=protein_coding / is_pseudo=false
MSENLEKLFNEEDSKLKQLKNQDIYTILRFFINAYSTCIICDTKNKKEQAFRSAYRGTQIYLVVLQKHPNFASVVSQSKKKDATEKVSTMLDILERLKPEIKQKLASGNPIDEPEEHVASAEEQELERKKCNEEIVGVSKTPMDLCLSIPIASDDDLSELFSGLKIDEDKSLIREQEPIDFDSSSKSVSLTPANSIPVSTFVPSYGYSSSHSASSTTQKSGSTTYASSSSASASQQQASHVSPNSSLSTDPSPSQPPSLTSSSIQFTTSSQPSHPASTVCAAGAGFYVAPSVIAQSQQGWARNSFTPTTQLPPAFTTQNPSKQISYSHTSVIPLHSQPSLPPHIQAQTQTQTQIPPFYSQPPPLSSPHPLPPSSSFPPSFPPPSSYPLPQCTQQFSSPSAAPPPFSSSSPSSSYSSPSPSPSSLSPFPYSSSQTTHQPPFQSTPYSSFPQSSSSYPSSSSSSSSSPSSSSSHSLPLPSLSPPIRDIHTTLLLPPNPLFRRIFVPFSLIRHFIAAAAENNRMDIETCGMLCGKIIEKREEVERVRKMAREGVIANKEVGKVMGALSSTSLSSTASQSLLVLSTVVIPKQHGTKDTCQAEGEEEIEEYITGNDLIMMGWIHTHPTQK